MKLLVCVCEYPPYYSSGEGNVAYEVVEQLKRMGVGCTVCSPNGDIKLGSSQIIQKYGRLGIYHYWHEVKEHFKRGGNNYDVVWLHQPLSIEKLPFSTALITVHTTVWAYNPSGYPLNLKLYYAIVSRIEKYCLRRVDVDGVRFTGVSQQVCKELEEIGIEKERIIYIPNGVNTNLFKPSVDKQILRKKFGIPEGNLIMLSLGRLHLIKQPQKLIEVFSRIEKKMEDVTLVIAGKGELLEKTKELVRQKELKNVIFLGYVDHEKEAPDLYACSDVYIMTSKYEGLPLTLLEAMASGLPCIVSDIPNLKIVEDANCGIMVDFNDEKKASQVIISYLEKDNLEHVKNARDYAINNLDWEVIAKKYIKLINEIL